MAFKDYSSAMKMRDIVRRIVKKTLEEERPRIRYGIVQSVSTSSRTAMVLYAGESEPTEVPYGLVIIPQVAQRVRVDGPRGDRYIQDVLPA